MSYSILYRAMHVKTSKGILPMVEMGDNNVWECGNKRRARGWYNLHIGDKFLFETWDAIADALKSWDNEYREQQEEYRNSDEQWKRETAGYAYGYFLSMAVYGKSTHKTTFNDVRNLVRKGMKFMLTIDEAIERKMLYIVGEWENGKRQPNVLVDSEQMLLDALNNKRWVVFNYKANNLYDTMSKVMKMCKPHKDGTECKIEVVGHDGVSRYLAMNEEHSKLILVDDESTGEWFKPLVGTNLSWLIRSFFDFEKVLYHYKN